MSGISSLSLRVPYIDKYFNWVASKVVVYDYTSDVANFLGMWST